MKKIRKTKTAIILLVVSILIGLSLLLIQGDRTQKGGDDIAAAPVGAEADGSGMTVTSLKVETNGGDRRSADQDSRKIALTFDDGPHPFYTEQLLDGLRERGVKVTFFVTGEHASLHPEVIRRMQEEGHLVGNHTYSHMQLRKDNREEFKQELVQTNEVIRDITGEETMFVRPPYGSWDKSFEKELNMFPVLWTVDPLDWCSQNVSCVTGRIVGHVKENDIILMHDYYESTVTAALQVVDALQAEGYTFVTVDEILFD